MGIDNLFDEIYLYNVILPRQLVGLTLINILGRIIIITIGCIGLSVGVGAPALAGELPRARRVLQLGQRLHVQHLRSYVTCHSK